MNGRNESWELVVATPEDAQGIQKVFDDGDFKGDISVKFNRTPNPYRSFQNDGDHIVLPVAKDISTGDVLGVGGCVIRRAYVNGALQNTAYLTGLKILQSHQRRLNCIKPAYQLIRDQTAHYTPFYYTTILKSNEAAIKLLEKQRKDMPSYIYLGDYTVFFLGTGGKSNSKGYTFERGYNDTLAAFYQDHLPKYNLAPASERLYGLTDNRFYCLKSPAGEILAACAIWDQQSYKQYIISDYGGIYKALSHLPIGLLGYPTMPKAGESANYASIAALIILEENQAIARLFLDLVLREAKQYDFMMLGLFENHPLTNVAQKFKHIKYQSRLYAVDYAKTPELSRGLDERPILLEVGLL
ncbi:MAG: hypothetical protein FWG40_10210 [Peptococcaceae bacterium]|nr:hypothetical protein [Peptococcaceae bacterium]